MMKLFPKSLVTSLAVLIFLFGMSTNVLAKDVNCHFVDDHLECDGEVFSQSLDGINTILADLDLTLTAASWPVENPTEVSGDIISLTIYDPGLVTIFKCANTTYIYPTGGLPSFTMSDSQGISSYVSVPDADIMLLLGTAFMFLPFLSRRKKKI
jgi:hypothetical protein